MLKLSPFAFLLSLVTVACLGCGQAPPATTILSIDRSLSAADHVNEFAQAAININQSVNPNDAFEFYVFDSTVSQVHIGTDVEVGAFKEMVTTAVFPRAGKHPSDLSVLVQRLDDRVKARKFRPARVVIITDCGMDGTTDKEAAAAAETVKAWINDGVTIDVLGVDPGRIDDLTKIFPPERIHTGFEANN